MQVHILFYLLLLAAVTPVFADVCSLKALHFVHG